MSKAAEIFRKIAVFPFVALIKFYKAAISPLLPSACRFVPTCSQYGLESFQKHGPIKGFYLTARRLLRCHPLGGSGYDPVPETFTYGDMFRKRENWSCPENNGTSTEK